MNKHSAVIVQQILHPIGLVTSLITLAIQSSISQGNRVAALIRRALHSRERLFDMQTLLNIVEGMVRRKEQSEPLDNYGVEAERDAW